MTQYVKNAALSVSSTNTTILSQVPPGMRRTSFIVTNTSALAVVTLSMGVNAAVAGSGIRLTPNGAYIQSTDSGFNSYQGFIQAVSDVAGTIGIVETLED